MITNLTPHEVRVIGEDGEEDKVFPPSGQVARLASVTQGGFALGGVGMVLEVEFGKLVDPPPEHLGAYYIVSLPTALAVRRDDFLVPFNEVRDDSGRIIGCRNLARAL